MKATFDQLHDYYYLMPVRNDEGQMKAPVFSFTKNRDKKIEKHHFKTGRQGIQTGYGGLEVLDIDNKFGDAKQYYDLVCDTCSVDHMPHVSTPSGGFHIYYLNEVEAGSMKLASRTNKKLPDEHAVDREKGEKAIAILETRGHTAFVVAPPTEGYKLINGDILDVPFISVDERNFILDFCRSQNEYVVESKIKGNSPNQASGDGEKSGTKFNSDSSSISEVASLLTARGWTTSNNIDWCRPGKSLPAVSATLGKAYSRSGNPLFHIFSTSVDLPDTNYTLFGVFAEYACNGNYQEAAKELGKRYNTYPSKNTSGKKKVIKEKSNDEYDAEIENIKRIIRVGTNYFKIIDGELTVWNRQTIVDDYDKDALRSIAKYDKFVNRPGHTDFKQTFGNFYNMYKPPTVTPRSGEFPTIKKLMNHIFGDEQEELAYDWIQISYLNPYQRLPIICLISKENETGKSTFSDMMGLIYGKNFASISQGEYSSEFNSSFADKNIVNIEEGKMKQSDIDRLKKDSTSPRIFLRKMHADRAEIDCFMKIIIQSNEIDDFLSLSKNDNRFWIKKVSKAKDFDPNFIDKIKDEIPHFINYICNRKLSVEKSEGRFWIGHERYLGTEFENVVRNSRNPLITDMYMKMLDDMDAGSQQFVCGSSVKFKEWYMPNNHNISATSIQRAITDDFGIKRSSGRYDRYNQDLDIKTYNGNYYVIPILEIKKILGMDYEIVPDAGFSVGAEASAVSPVVPSPIPESSILPGLFDEEVPF